MFQHRFSVLPALTLDGVIYSSIQVGAFNGDTFLEFIEGLLEEMNPYPAARSVLVMDNCSIHHVDGVRAICEEKYVTAPL
jgi:transposase